MVFRIASIGASPAKYGGDGRHRYHVWWDSKFNTFHCTCQDYIYRKRKDGEECKHIKFVQALFGGIQWWRDTGPRGAILNVPMLMKEK